MKKRLIAITRDPISLLGVAITTASALLIICLFTFELVGFLGNPYIGILAYLVLPAIFVFGLCLIPIGMVRERRRSRRAVARGEAAPRFPVVDLNISRTRTVVLTVLLLTMANLVILATVTFKGVEVMESSEFCGETCHMVMQPEYTAYQRSPHARVGCVDCHIGPGADWFVKSKLSGAWQVVSVALDLYPRPIPTPVHNLRPARETCEQCHWPTQFVGDRLKVITSHESDEQNTELKSVVLVRVGGMQGRESEGIHWHVDPGNQIRYRSDPTRETIYEVELTLPDGTVKLFEGPESAPDAEIHEDWRIMDCVDCHNRPTHIYRLPEREVDLAMESGELDRALPYLRRESLEALNVEYASHDEARTGIADSLVAFYRESYPEVSATKGESIEQASQTLGTIYASNIFPDMKVGWGTYPNHIGHMDFPGCFRCHDDEHRTVDGEYISQDCDTCHTVLAMEEEDPEVLEQLQP